MNDHGILSRVSNVLLVELILNVLAEDRNLWIIQERIFMVFWHFQLFWWLLCSYLGHLLALNLTFGQLLEIIFEIHNLISVNDFGGLVNFCVLACY